MKKSDRRKILLRTFAYIRGKKNKVKKQKFKFDYFTEKW